MCLIGSFPLASNLKRIKTLSQFVKCLITFHQTWTFGALIQSVWFNAHLLVSIVGLARPIENSSQLNPSATIQRDPRAQLSP